MGESWDHQEYDTGYTGVYLKLGYIIIHVVKFWNVQRERDDDPCDFTGTQFSDILFDMFWE